MTTLVLTVTLSRSEGLFVGADELGQQLQEAIEGADLDGLGANGDSTYEVESVEVATAAQVRQAVQAVAQRARLQAHGKYGR